MTNIFFLISSNYIVRDSPKFENFSKSFVERICNYSCLLIPWQGYDLKVLKIELTFLS